MSEFVEYLPDGGEPITLGEVKANSRMDPDQIDDDLHIESIVIPGVRQLAESRTGAAIRPARYRQRLQAFPKSGGAIAITHSLVQAIESITYAGSHGARVTLDPAAYETAVIDREPLVAPLSGEWPATVPSLRAVEITYIAGLPPAEFALRYPSVRQWLLLAASWACDNRELFVSGGGDAFQELPADYGSLLVDPIMVRTRF